MRVTLELNGETGAIVTREDFADRHWVDRLIGIGIAAHEGQLFGWFNQLLGLIATGGLVLLSLSGFLLWWRRREPGTLGAPKLLQEPRHSGWLMIIVGALAIYLPLFAISLLLVFMLERLLLRRIPSVRDWLGLGYHEVMA